MPRSSILREISPLVTTRPDSDSEPLRESYSPASNFTEAGGSDGGGTRYPSGPSPRFRPMIAPISPDDLGSRKPGLAIASSTSRIVLTEGTTLVRTPVPETDASISPICSLLLGSAW